MNGPIFEFILFYFGFLLLSISSSLPSSLLSVLPYQYDQSRVFRIDILRRSHFLKEKERKKKVKCSFLFTVCDCPHFPSPFFSPLPSFFPISHSPSLPRLFQPRIYLSCSDHLSSSTLTVQPTGREENRVEIQPWMVKEVREA